MGAVQAVIFDLGGTLLYFDGDWLEAIPQSLVALLGSLLASGLDNLDEAFLEQFRVRMEAYYAQRETEHVERTTASVLRGMLSEWGHPNVNDKVMSRALAAMYAVTQAYWKPELDAASTLAALTRQGYRLGLISNAGDDPDVQTLVDKAKLRPFLDFVITSAAEGIRKPNPRIFEIALDRWGMKPSQAVMVGDSLGADILGAQNAGVFAIWITRRANAANRFYEDTIRPDVKLDTLSELPALLATM